MSQEQLDQAKQQEPVTEDGGAASTAEENKASSVAVSTAPDAGDELATRNLVAKKKRVKKKMEPFDEKAATSRPSFWPLVLAFSVAVLLLGVVSNLVIVGVGVLLIVASTIGWGLERR